MRYIYTFFSLIIFTALFSNCAGNKNLQAKAPAQMQQAYYTAKGTSLNLYIPVSAIQTERVELNSVYFRGKKADLEQDPTSPGVYVAKITTGKEDMIMSSDPKEEYGNKIPRSEEMPDFKLKDDEAILIFTQNDKEKYYKITDIVDRTQQ